MFFLVSSKKTCIEIGLSLGKPTGCSDHEAGYAVTCSQLGTHFVLKINGINLPSFQSRLFFFKEVEAKFIMKGGGYLTLPEQTRNVQCRGETMGFCSHLNPFVFLSVVSVMA